nr:immunoglobulin heavy chain junction region [Mus musculus]
CTRRRWLLWAMDYW